MKNLSRSVPFALVAMLATPALAQTSAPATPLPDLDGFSLPSSRPTPRIAPDAEPTTGASAPRPTPTPTPTPPVVAAPVAPPRVVPAVRPSPVARPTAAPRVIVPQRPAPVATPTTAPIATRPTSAPVIGPTPSNAPTPVVAPTPAPTASASSPAPEPSPSTGAATEARSSWIWAALAILAAAFAGVGLLAWRRRQGGDATETSDDGIAPEPPIETALPTPVPADTPAPLQAAPRASAARARIEIDCIPTRAGTNLLSVAVDYRIVVRNVGDAVATGVRLDIRLLGMGTQHDALLTALFAMPVAKSIAAPFDLPPGTAVDLGGMAMHPKDTIDTVEIGGRQMVVPLLAVNLRYGWPDAGEGQTARPFVVGIDPGTGGRLQPFRLDGGARMLQNVAIIAYTDGITT